MLCNEHSIAGVCMTCIVEQNIGHNIGHNIDSLYYTQRVTGDIEHWTPQSTE